MKKIDLKVCLLLVLGLAISTMTNAQDITEFELEQQRLLVEGNKNFLLEDYDKAMDSYNQAYQKDNNNTALLWSISRVHMARRDYELAIKAIDKALNIESDNKWYWEHLVAVQKKTRDAPGLVKSFTKLHELEPKSDEYAFELVKYLDQNKEYKAALKVLTKMDVEDLGRPSICYRKARIYEKMNNLKKAEKEYVRMTVDYPKEPRYMHLLAAFYQSQNDSEKANQTYQKILKLNPDDSKAALALSNQLRNSGNDIQYLESIRKVIESPSINIDVKVKELIPYVQKVQTNNDPSLKKIIQEYASTISNIHSDEAKAFALKADIHSMLSEDDLALASYKKALELDQTVYLVWEQYLYLLLEKNKIKELAQKSEEALDYFPNRGRIYFFLGFAQMQQGDYKAANQELNQALMMTGRNVRLKFDLLQLLGQVNHEAGNYPESDKYFEKALGLNDKNPDLLAAYSLALAERKEKITEAENLLAKAQNLQPENKNILMAQAWIAIAKDQFEDAKSILDQLLESHPTPYIYEKYGDMLQLQGDTKSAKEYWGKALAGGGPEVRLKRKIQSQKSTSSGI